MIPHVTVLFAEVLLPPKASVHPCALDASGPSACVPVPAPQVITRVS